MRNMSRVRCAAHWSSWTDCLPMVQKRHPHICRWIVGALTRHEPLPFVHAVLACEREVRVAGLDAPPWHELTQEVLVDVDHESEPNQPRRGRQKKAAGAVDNKFFSEEFWPVLSGQERALIRSQTGPLSAVPFFALPTDRFSRFDPQPFRVLLLRRLHFPLPLSARLCRCGRPLDLCATIGLRVLWQGFLGEGVSPWSARVRTNQCHGPGHGLAPSSSIGWQKTGSCCRRSPLYRGAQLAIDTTLVAVLKRDGTPRTGADRTKGVALASARQRKERTYPEPSGEGSRATLVVLAAEVGGRWSTEARDFLVALAAVKGREAPFLLESSVKAAWLFRWSCMLACTAARSFALSLVDGLAPGVDGAVCLRRGTCEVLPVAFFLGLTDPSAETDFGQSDFGHPYWPTLANSDFGQTNFGPNWCFSLSGARAQTWKKWGPETVGPRRVGPRRVGGPKFRAFFLSPTGFVLSFFSLLGVLSWNFGGV